MDEQIDYTLKIGKKLSSTISGAVVDYYSDSLKIKDNKVVFDTGNISIINNLAKKLYKNEDISKLINSAKRFILETIMKSLKSIFESTKIDVGSIKKSEKVNTIIENHAIRNVDRLTDLGDIFEDIRKKSISLMSSFEGISLHELRDALKSQIDEKDLVSHYWKRWTYDIYSQYQRAGANEFRKELGLNFAIFEGDLIKTSRDWCEDHAGNVYYIDEINAWEDEDWKGKTEINYNPIIDLGGYNCRHQLRWISKELAKRLRPEVVTLFPKEFE